MRETKNGRPYYGAIERILEDPDRDYSPEGSTDGLAEKGLFPRQRANFFHLLTRLFELFSRVNKSISRKHLGRRPEAWVTLVFPTVKS